MVIVVILYFIHHGIISVWHNTGLNYTVATFFLLLFGLFVYRIERKEFDNLFKIGRSSA